MRATFEALKNEDSPRAVAARRGKRVADIIGGMKRDGGAGGEPHPVEAAGV